MSERDERRRRILGQVAAVPPGSVATYGQIAELAGVPRGARQVGRCLSELPPDTEIPWHRIIAAGGRLSLPPDSDAYREQCRRLAAEGVTVLAGRVSMRRFAWEPDLDELLWKPPGL